MAAARRAGGNPGDAQRVKHEASRRSPSMNAQAESKSRSGYYNIQAPGSNLFKHGKTFRTIALRQQWQREGVFGWNNARVSRLCQQMNVTVWDLAAMMAIFDENGDIDSYLVNKFWREDSWPSYIGVMLCQLERESHGRLTGS